MPQHFEIGVPPLQGGGGIADDTPLKIRKGAAGNGRAFFVFESIPGKTGDRDEA